MKKIIAIILLIFLLSGCVASKDNNKQAGPPPKVTIGTQTLANPESIAKAQGWLSEALGTEVDIVRFDSGRDVNTAMASGAIDFGMLGSVPASLAIANGVQCKVVYIQSVLGEIESLVIQNNLGVTKAQELAGMKIATTFSSTAHYSLMKYLEANGVDSSEVDIIDMKASEIVAAFLRGDIDGAFTWEPQVTLLINAGGIPLTSAKEVSELGYATLDVEIVNIDFAEKYPDLVKAYIRCMERAVKLYKNDSEAAGEALALDMGLTAEECLAQVKSSRWITVEEQKLEQWFGTSALAENLYDTAMFLYKQGDLTSEPSLDFFKSVVDGQYLGINEGA